MKITVLILFSLFLGSEALGQQPGSNPKRLPNGRPIQIGLTRLAGGKGPMSSLCRDEQLSA